MEGVHRDQVIERIRGFCGSSTSTVKKEKKKMQLDVGSEPYLSTAQALCLFSNHTFYYKTFANWQRITAMAKSEFFAYAPIKALCCGEVSDS